MFIPGETIVHRFYLPFEHSNIDTVYITYIQDKEIILEIRTNSFTVYQGETLVTVQLTEEQSLLFGDNAPFLVQLNVIFKDGTRCTSELMKGRNGVQLLREDVVTNGEWYF